PANGVPEPSIPPWIMTIPRTRTIVLSTIALAIAIQFVPIRHDNPPATGSLTAPATVSPILRRACYDCHSHETIWPWYSYVAPVSWLVANDVSDGRRHLNFSTWNRLKPEVLPKVMHEAWSEIEHNEMPLWYYLPMHPAARLSDADKAL